MTQLNPDISALQPEMDGLPTPRRYWAIAAIILAIVVSVIDSTIANVALPVIAADLGADAPTAIWIVTAYQIPLVMALLPLSTLGELVGYKRVSQAGLVVFTIASLLCALSQDIVQLSAARVLQGFGAAGIMSVNGALVRFTYPQNMLGRAIGINAVVVSISAVIGPTIASGILAVADWRMLFLINVPIGAVGALIAWLNLPDSPRISRTPNPLGALLTALSFGLFISGLQTLAHGSAGLTLSMVQLIAALGFGAGLIAHERRRQHPMIPFDLLSRPLFSLSALTSIGSFMAQMLALVALPFSLHRLGVDPVHIGLLMTPWPLAVAAAAPIAGHLSDRYPAGLLGGVGLAVFALGLATLATAPANDTIWRMALCGLGFGFFQAPNNRAMLSSAPRIRSGAASGVLGTSRVLGQSLGAASAALLFAHLSNVDGAPFYAASAIALCAALISLSRLRTPSSA